LNTPESTFAPRTTICWLDNWEIDLISGFCLFTKNLAGTLSFSNSSALSRICLKISWRSSCARSKALSLSSF
jgi:hypothetical protein